MSFGAFVGEGEEGGEDYIGGIQTGKYHIWHF